MVFWESLLYRPPAPSYSYNSFPGELLWIPSDLTYASCTDCFPALFLHCPAARYMVIYFHGSGEDMGNCYSFGSSMRQFLEVHVLLVEYPGYGIAPWHSSEESLWQVALSAYRFVSEVMHFPAEDIMLMGRSLGAALATRLARKCKCNGLILIAPFLSLQHVVSQYLGFLAPMIVGDTYNNELHIRDVKVPLLIVHGQNDFVVPCGHGRRLFELCPHDRKLFVCPKDMAHNTSLLIDPAFFFEPMLTLFALPDYSFVDLRPPPEAFDKRLCPSYHNLVELSKDSTNLEQPLGDQEPGPTWSTVAGPQCVPLSARSMQTMAGDVDDLQWSGEHSVFDDGGSASSSGLVGVAAPEGIQANVSDSTTAGSSSGTRPSEPSPGAPSSPYPAEEGLDIEGGVSRFLQSRLRARPNAAL